MYLKSLKLAGFKSFANPTTLQFGRHINAIVGPNGCGKSNVIDAIRWVLGESHAKQLRGASMSDVIFVGTQGKVGRSVASVELLLAHSQEDTHGIRHALNLYDELSIRRQVTKEGKSTYFINGQKVRRRDVVDVFLGTGLSSRGYAVIEQGMIGRIIEADGQSLRRFIEEAAGVSRYEARLNDTQKQLAAAKDNLARLNDVQNELKAKQKHLTAQAKKADEYQTLKQAYHNTKALWYQTKLFGAWQAHQQAQAFDARLVEALRQQQNTVDALTAKYTAEQHCTDDLNQQTQALAQAVHEANLNAQTLSHKRQQTADQLQHATQALALIKPPPLPKQSDLQYLLGQFDELVQVINTKTQMAKTVEEQYRQAKDDRQQLFDKVHTLKNELAMAQGTLNQLIKAQRALPTPKAPISDTDPKIKSHRISQLQRCMALLDSIDEPNGQAWQTMLDNTKHAQRLLENNQAALLAEQKVLKQALPSGDRLTILSALTLSQLGQRHAKTLDEGLGFLWGDAVGVPEEGVDGGWWQSEYPSTGGSLHPKIIVLSDLIVAPALDLFAHSYLVDGLTLPKMATDALYRHLCQWVQGTPAGFIVAGRFIHRFGATAVMAGAGYVGQKKRLDEVQAELFVIDKQLVQYSDQYAKQKAVFDDVNVLCALYCRLKSALQTMLTHAQKEHALALVASEQAKYAKERYDELVKQKHTLDDEQKKAQVCVDELSAALQVLQSKFNQQQSLTDELLKQHNQKKQTLLTLSRDKDKKSLAIDAWRQQKAKAQEIAANNATQTEHYQTAITTLTKTLHLCCDDEQQALDALKTKEAHLATCKERFAQSKSACEKLKKALALEQQALSQASKQQIHAQTDVALCLAKLQDVAEAYQSFDESFVLTKTLQDFDMGQAVADIATVQDELDKLKQQISAMGAVNLTAKAELDELNARLLPQIAQTLDIENSIKTLQNASKTINEQSKQRFMATLEAVNQSFGALFAKVFDGGQASLQLDDTQLPASERWRADLVLMAQPKGKKNSRLSVLSGGEKTLTALSLIFAIFRQHPAPFCVLDEVDAPLDDANVARFGELIKELAQNVQFIFISHNKLAMTYADELIGITMPSAGISSVVSVDLQMASAMVENDG